MVNDGIDDGKGYAYILLLFILLLTGCLQGGKPETQPHVTLPATTSTTFIIPVNISFVEEEIPYSGQVMNAAVVAGKLAYAMRTSEGTVLIYDGTEYTRETDPVTTISDVGGKIAYTVNFRVDREGISYIMYDGKEYGREYYGADYPKDIGGKLAYIAFKPEEGA